MIPEDALRYKIEEVDIVRKDIEDLEEDILIALSGSDEDEIKDLRRKKRLHSVYLRDLLEEIDELRKETYAHDGAPSEVDARGGNPPDHREDKETSGRGETYYQGHRLQNPKGAKEKPSDKTEEEGLPHETNPEPHGSIVDPAR
jgi:hypothetical protein